MSATNTPTEKIIRMVKMTGMRHKTLVDKFGLDIWKWSKLANGQQYLLNPEDVPAIKKLTDYLIATGDLPASFNALHDGEAEHCKVDMMKIVKGETSMVKAARMLDTTPSVLKTCLNYEPFRSRPRTRQDLVRCGAIAKTLLANGYDKHELVLKKEPCKTKTTIEVTCTDIAQLIGIALECRDYLKDLSDSLGKKA